MGYFFKPFYLSNIINVLKTWRKPGMYTEDLTIYLSCNREEIKEVHELSPDEGASVFTNNFSLEPVRLSNLSCLMVTPQ